MPETCDFCALIADRSRLVTPLIFEWPDAIALVPLNPCTAGHTVVLPKAHVRDAVEDPIVTAAVMARAASLAVPPTNLIINAGKLAGQTVKHLHVHIVPRRVGDGLQMPWSWQEGRS